MNKNRFILNKTLNLDSNIDSKLFPDTEVYLRISDIQSISPNTDDAAYIASSLFPDINTQLIRLFFAIRYLSKHYTDINLFLPYMSYARQDKSFLKGEVQSSFELIAILKKLSVSKILTVDCHFIKKQF